MNFFLLLALAATPTPGRWECQSMAADTDAKVSVRGDEVVIYRAMYPEFEGKPYKLEHLFRMKVSGSKLKGQLFVRDDPKAEFTPLRVLDGEVVSESEMKLDDMPLKLVEAGDGQVELTPSVPVKETVGLGYFAQVVRGTGSASDLFALHAGISLTREGEAALDEGEAAFARGAWAPATAAFEKALGSGVPVSRFAEHAARAWLSLKDCAHAEAMVTRAQRLDPESTDTVELGRDVAKTCPKASASASAKAQLARKRKPPALELDPNGAPLRTFEDVLEVLRLDEVSRFSAGLAFIATLKDVKARAMRGQLELSWAEALSLLAEMNVNLAARLREFAAASERQAAADGLSPDEFRALGELRATALSTSQTAEALKLAAAEHLARGLELAAQVIKSNPDNYLGYRVAADSYRLRGDWKNFERMLAKVEKTNPGSNGLLFLKGVAAAQRDRDGVSAAKYFSAALAKDPKFARAQVHLVLIAPTLEDAKVELDKLAAINPRHPFVVWTAPALAKLAAEEEH